MPAKCSGAWDAPYGLAARKVHTPAEYQAMAEPILLELQQREQEILTYLSRTDTELSVE